MTQNMQTERNDETFRQSSTLEEWKAGKEAEREEVFRMVDEATAAVVSDPDKLAEYWEVQSRLSRYSVSNALLICRQYPEAVQLKDFSEWSSQKVLIQKGEKSIRILEPASYTRKNGEPGFSCRVRKVFDIRQTTCEEQPLPPPRRDPKQLIRLMFAACPVRVIQADRLPDPTRAVCYRPEDRVLLVSRNIRDIGDDVQLCRDLAEELAVIRFSAEDPEGFKREQEDFLISAAADMICREQGIPEPRSEPAVMPEACRSCSLQAVRKELSRIRRTANSISADIRDQEARQNPKYEREEAR